jgi:protein-disulfide isomerase
MKHLIVLLTLASLAFSNAACGQAASDAPGGSAADREARILANLVFEFPQLGQQRVEIGSIEPSGVDGLDEGTFTINGQQTQGFLVTEDDARLYLLAAPAIDVSRTADDLAAARAEQDAAAAAEVGERRDQLDAFVAGLPLRGNPDADITIVEFSDFQCPYCARAANTVEEVLAEHGDDVRFAYLQFPLGNHPWARPASIAALCAAQQDDDAFWTLHDGYFANQRALNPGNVIAQSRSYLADAGLDMGAWSTCVEDTDSAAHEQAVTALEAQVALAQELGVTGTPGFFVNGRFVNGAQPAETFEALIEASRQDS